MDSTIFAPAAVASNNSLVYGLAPEEYERLRHLFRPVELEARQTLYAPGERVAHAYFPEGAVATTVAAMGDGSTAETSMVGREGVVGAGAAVGETRARHWTRVLVPGARRGVPPDAGDHRAAVGREARGRQRVRRRAAKARRRRAQARLHTRAARRRARSVGLLLPPRLQSGDALGRARRTGVELNGDEIG
jgi:hypothetical protein